MKTELGGLKSIGRQLLGKLLQASKENFTVAEASQILNVSRYRAASLLATWTRNGWLHRVRRGLYIPSITIYLLKSVTTLAIASAALAASILL